jgi:UDP-N-acetylglucosamine--N-acetylmuramyl-(pentapeptide) pyrophosphoryl-undecaprenol N-acetylglucosamine transferase
MKIAIAGGGTAGHIEPALNTADAIRKLDPTAQFVVLGTERGLEVTLVPARGYELSLIPAVPLPRKINKDLFTLPARLRDAITKTKQAIAGSDVLVGFGGYVAMPAYFAARSLKIPIVVHEANAKAGLANRIGARFAVRVLETVGGSIQHGTRVGLPLRSAIADFDKSQARQAGLDFWKLSPNRPTLLVFGGSQGARSLNKVVAAASFELTELGWQILHSVGKGNPDFLTDSNPHYRTVDYIENMAWAYGVADVAVTRAGAMSVAELTATAVPSIYVPLPIGNGEQRLNAQPVVEAGGGVIFSDSEFTSERLIQKIAEWESVGLLNLSNKLKLMTTSNAAEQIAEICLEVAKVKL